MEENGEFNEYYPKIDETTENAKKQITILKLDWIKIAITLIKK